jgi:hypothetical protein
MTMLEIGLVMNNSGFNVDDTVIPVEQKNQIANINLIVSIRYLNGYNNCSLWSVKVHRRRISGIHYG